MRLSAQRAGSSASRGLLLGHPESQRSAREGPTRPSAIPVILGKPRSESAFETGGETLSLSLTQLSSWIDLGQSMSFGPDEPRIDARRLRLAPGDRLYSHDDAPKHIFLIETGVFQRSRMALADMPRVQASHPEVIAFCGAGELLGLHLRKATRQESASAITASTVLALAIDSIERIPDGSGLLSDMLVRPVSAALIRDWRLAYRLRDLAPAERTLEGLSHVADLAGTPLRDCRDGQALEVALPVEVLAAWLGLGAAVLGQALDSLVRRGIIVMRDGQITRIDMFAVRGRPCPTIADMFAV